jgi:hypothetical protein
MFQGFLNKMTVIMKFSAMGPIGFPPWCSVFVMYIDGPRSTARLFSIQVASTMLRTVGVEFDVAQNGKEAVDLITAGGDDRKKWHDIVLMDVQMPVMDGLQVRKQWHDSAGGRFWLSNLVLIHCLVQK